MARTFITSAVAGVFLLGMATAALAATGEPGDICAMGLARGKAAESDCSISSGKAERFGVAMAYAMKKPKKYLAKPTQGRPCAYYHTPEWYIRKQLVEGGRLPSLMLPCGASRW
jgi:hypothetical protein